MLFISKAIFQRDILNLVVKNEFANFLHKHTYIFFESDSNGEWQSSSYAFSSSPKTGKDFF